MQSAEVHRSEAARLASLRELHLLDTSPEERFDRIVRLAASVLDVPIALVSLIDEDRQWFKARVGLAVTETPRDVAFCAHAVVDEDSTTMVVPDALADSRFADNPLVTGDPDIRFYAGQVVHAPDGLPMGTLCVIDRKPRDMDEAQLQVLADLAALVEDEFTRERGEAVLARLHRSEQMKTSVLDALSEGVILMDDLGKIIEWNPSAERLLGLGHDEMAAIRPADPPWDAIHEDGTPWPGDTHPAVVCLQTGESVPSVTMGVQRRDGTLVWLEVSSAATVGALGERQVLTTFTDVTGKHLAALDVARFQHLFEHSNDIITVIDPNGQVLYASPSIERILGYPAGWRHPDGILGIVHPEDVDSVFEELVHLVAGTRGPEPFMVRVRSYSGAWRHVECVGTDLLEEPAVQGIVITARDATDRVRLAEQLAHLASHDPLTDLPNRSVLEPRLEQALARAKREGGRVGLCFIDLDGFKLVNDLHGHASGDAVIVEVADRIRSASRAGDTAVRVGGDEFIVILDPISDLAHVADAACRIRDAIIDPPILRGEQAVGASVGVALNRDDERPASLLLRADAALYEAKQSRCSAVEVAPT